MWSFPSAPILISEQVFPVKKPFLFYDMSVCPFNTALNARYEVVVVVDACRSVKLFEWLEDSGISKTITV
jgi:hypothetical protein